MKRLPPSIQEKTRYLRFKVHSEVDPEFPELVNALWDVLLDELGTIELSKAEVWIIKNKYDQDSAEGVIQVNREMENSIRSALLFLEQIDGQEAFIEITRTSGMVDKV